MEQVEWGEYKLWDEKIFEIWTGSLVDIKTASEWKIPRVSVQTTNNWILWYYDETLENARYFENFISINFFWIAYYHPYRASVEMKVHTLKLVNHELTKWEWLFMTGMLNKRFIWKYSYGSQLSSSKLKNENFKIQLPTKNWEIDFEFMEMFIKELESYHIKELESYLQVTWLKDYNLIEQEEKSLNDFENGKIEWREFKIGDLYEVLPVNKKYSKLDIEENWKIPIYSSDSSNNWIIWYCNKEPLYSIDSKVKYLEIFWDHTRTMNIAKESFCITDNVKVLKPLYFNIKCTLFINSSWKKSIPNLWYARHWSKAKISKFQLPVKNWEIDFDFMETFISAIQKLVIKDVVDYVDKKMTAYHKVIN